MQKIITLAVIIISIFIGYLFFSSYFVDTKTNEKATNTENPYPVDTDDAFVDVTEEPNPRYDASQKEALQTQENRTSKRTTNDTAHYEKEKARILDAAAAYMSIVTFGDNDAEYGKLPMLSRVMTDSGLQSYMKSVDPSIVLSDNDIEKIRSIGEESSTVNVRTSIENSAVEFSAGGQSAHAIAIIASGRNQYTEQYAVLLDLSFVLEDGRWLICDIGTSRLL